MTATKRSESPSTGSPKIRVTIRDIADEAGVHFTTVSLALRDHPRLPGSTRKRIRKIADRMGYRPDPMLTALNAYRSSKTPPQFQATIAWINNWPERDQLLAIEQFREYFAGARGRAGELGYELDEFWLREPGMTATRLRRILKARSITAALLAPQPVAHPPLDLDYQQLSAVAFGYSIQPPVLHVVTNHHFHSMNLITEQLYRLGYRRPGLFFPSDWDEKAENSCQGGLTLACWKWPEMKMVPPLLQSDPIDKDLSRWLDKHQPDVVISHSPMADRLRNLGFRLPRDLGFVSLNLPRDEKELSGIYQNDRMIGRIALDLIVAMIHRGERGLPSVPVRTLVESVWIPGKTLKKQAGKSRSA